VAAVTTTSATSAAGELDGDVFSSASSVIARQFNGVSARRTLGCL
jgi:hypothetical protein